jgi:hypothetical protein
MKTRVALVFLVTAAAIATAVAGSAMASSNAVVASTTGAGTSTFGGELRTFSFSARKYSDGSVRGQAQLVNRAQDRVFHMKLDCLVASGNAAYVSGTVTHSSIPSDVGTIWDFKVVDNGEGANASPDQLTLAYIFSPQLPCTNGFVQSFLDGALFPIDHGNIQVH